MATSATPQTNVATVTADQFDPNPNNNTASATATPQQADLAVVKTVDNPRPNVGDTITYTVTVTNLGPSTATNVVVSDQVPAGVSLRQPPRVSQGTLNLALGIWNVGTLAPGASASMTVTARVDSPSAAANVVAVTGAQPDPNPGNNSSGVVVTPQRADLAITKTVSNAAPPV